MKIYVENLRNGNGDWIELPVDIENLMDNLGAEHLSELDVMDYEANFKLDNYRDINSINELAEILDDMDNTEKQIAENLIEEGIIVEWEDLVDAVHDVIIYSGCEDMEDVAIRIMEEDRAFDGTDERIERYFNYKSYGEDLSITGTYFEINGAIVEYLG